MSRAGLARIWGALGALLALYATGTWIILQGGKSFAEIPGLEAKAPVTSAYQAIPIIGVLLGVLAIVGLAHMRAKHQESESLFPIVAIADLGPHQLSAWSMRVYQGVFVLIFLLVPAAALVHLNSVVLQRGVLWHDGEPALSGIALKNAYGPSATIGPDANESACASTITRPKDGYVWLGNMRCDFAKAGRLKPFNKDGKSLADDAAGGPASSCTRDLALSQSRQQSCEGARDISEECETSERNCRGVQWLPFWSPVLLIVPAVFGWIMLIWLLGEAVCRKWSLKSAESGTPQI